MIRKGLRLRSALVGLCLAAALPVLAQTGHPVKGTWSGYWGPNPNEAHRILLAMDWVDRQIVGTINPGPKGVKIDKANLDLSDWTLTIEADMPRDNGRTERWVATGKLENLGSWTNRRYSGTYRFGDETGKFIVALN
ncbi:MAG TPA: hypothetical protein VFV10_14040 [Gammaproteobacteria bacterium]|nr:hypothetical protein [Gammaproteobacteria bacterium]